MTHALPVVARNGNGKILQFDGLLEITAEGQRKTPVVLRFITPKETQEVQLSVSKAKKVAAQLRQTALIC